jgi:hypothetical protein
MKSRSKKSRQTAVAGLRKIRGLLPADVDVVQLVREGHGRRIQIETDADAAESANERRVESFEIGSEMRKAGLSNIFIVAAVATANEFEGIFNLMKMWRAESDKGERYAIIADIQELIEDIAVATRPEAVARNPGIADVTMKARRGVYVAQHSYSDHMFADVLSVASHGLIAHKILNDPSLIKRARNTLEQWISKEQLVPQPLIEWRQILAGTPQEIAALALSLTEDATRLRSSSPLVSLLTQRERAAVRALFGKGRLRSRG